MIMWTNWLFCFSLLVLILFLFFNIKQLTNILFRNAMVFLTGICIVANLYFMWHTWESISVYDLNFRSVLMYWLSYPDYNVPIQLGIIALVYLMVPHKDFHFRCIAAANLVFMVSLFFQIRVLVKELPLNTPTPIGYANVFYQAQHALFISSLFIFLIMLVMKFSRIKAQHTEHIR
jgi:hypothetical protein